MEKRSPQMGEVIFNTFELKKRWISIQRTLTKQWEKHKQCNIKMGKSYKIGNLQKRKNKFNKHFEKLFNFTCNPDLKIKARRRSSHQPSLQNLEHLKYHVFTRLRPRRGAYTLLTSAEVSTITLESSLALKIHVLFFELFGNSMSTTQKKTLSV